MSIASSWRRSGPAARSSARSRYFAAVRGADSGDDLTLLGDLADRAALAIENARLYDALEQRVQQRTAALEAANRELEWVAAELSLASVRKSTFLANMSHELRTPLNAIIGFTSCTMA